MAKKKYTLAETSEIVGVTERMIRYYEDEGLVKSKRSKSNNKVFSENQVEYLKKISILKHNKYTTKIIKTVLKFVDIDTLVKEVA